MKSNIPKSFKVFASTINIYIENERLSLEGSLGDCNFNSSKISLCDSYKGKLINNSVVIDTFYHEKIHIILDAMGEYKLSNNEKFVEVFSRLLRQTDETLILNK